MSLDKSTTNFFELITRLMEPREGGVAMTVTLGHVRLHGLIARSAHITLLFFGVSSWDADAPQLAALLQRQRQLWPVPRIFY